jgi:DNA polymerase-3 subunit gamma/tau
VATLEPIVPLGDLIDRLGELEARIAGGGGGGGGAAQRPPQPGRGTPPPRQSPPALATGTAPGTARAVSVPTPTPAPKPVAATPAPAPTPPPAAAAAPSDPAAAWEKVIEALEQRRKLSLLGFFQHARVMAWTADAIELGYPAEFHSLGEMAREKSNLDEMRSFLREHTGHAVAIAVRMLDANESATAPARSVVERDHERSAEERRRREAELREHPVTKRVLQTFGAEIKEIKTDV